jgi:hypothetical protein
MRILLVVAYKKDDINDGFPAITLPFDFSAELKGRCFE